MFENATEWTQTEEIIQNIWTDLQQAYKFGSLIRLEEKLNIHLHGLQKTALPYLPSKR